MKNVLFSIKSLLEELVWKNKRRKEKNEWQLKNEAIQQYFNEFSNLLSEFTKQLKLEPEEDEG